VQKTIIDSETTKNIYSLVFLQGHRLVDAKKEDIGALIQDKFIQAFKSPIQSI